MMLGIAIIAAACPSNAETISPRRLLEVADLSGPVISPDGRNVAFRLEQASIERNTYDSFWYVQQLDGGAPPRLVAEGGVPLRDTAGLSLPAHAVWSPDGRWIYFRALVDGGVDIWRAAADGSGAEPLTRDPADVRDFSLSADGRTLFYIVGATREEVIAAEQAEYDSGIRIDNTAPVGQSLFRSGYIEGRLATQRYGSAWVWNRVFLLADVPDRWRAINLVTWERRDLASAERPAPLPTASDLSEALPETLALALEPSGNRVALLSAVGDGEEQGFLRREGRQLAMLPSIAASTPVVCLAELCTDQMITAVQWRPDSDEVLFTVTEPHEGLAQSIFRWNVRTGAVHLVNRASGLISGGRDQFRYTSCGLSAHALACVAAEADHPPRLERIDLDTGHRQVLFDPNAALAMDMAARTPARLLRWTDASGHEFTGQYFRARTADDAIPPLFVNYYSCAGFVRSGIGEEWPMASFAEHGISALCINRGTSRSDFVERYNMGLSAVASIVERLASEGEIDRNRVGMGGLSLGSEVTLWTVMKSDLLAAASITAPIVSRTYYLYGSLIGDAFIRNLRRVWQLGSPEETPERWQIIAPEHNLDRIRAPILMQMPEQEYSFALDYAIPLIRDRRADLYVFPHAAHHKFQPRQVLAANERNLDWFRFWLQGYVDPDPRKADQYRRWEAMRNRMRGS